MGNGERQVQERLGKTEKSLALLANQQQEPELKGEGPMRKVVINACHGGFGLSWAGMQALAARKGLVASYFSLSPDIHRRVYGDAPIDPDGIFTHRIVGPRLVASFEETARDPAFVSSSDLARDDADLVAVVEELGESANAPCAALRVVEIPDDVEWKVEEYDGSEWIAEAHRTWA